MIYEINRKEYKRIKTLDHFSMQEYLKNIYETGWKKGHEQGKAAGALENQGMSEDDIREALKDIKGIGEKRIKDIISALACNRS